MLTEEEFKEFHKKVYDTLDRIKTDLPDVHYLIDGIFEVFKYYQERFDTIEHALYVIKKSASFKIGDLHEKR